MKNSILFAAVLGLTLGFTACADDDLVNGGKTTHNEGDAIKFGVSVRDTRTFYGTGEGEDNWKIYWNFGKDKVRVFCNQTKEKQYDYVVAKSYKGDYDEKGNYLGTGTYDETGSGNSGVLKESSESGALKWVKGVDDKNDCHHFYAFYPASETYNVECMGYYEEKNAETGESYGTEHAIFKCPFKTEQTVAVSSTATNNVYTATPDMEAQYLMTALDGYRKYDNPNGLYQLGFGMSPVMTALDVVISRGEDKSDADVLSYITNLEFEVPLPATMATEGAFYEYLSSNGNRHELCDANGTLFSNWTDKTTTTTKFKVNISGGNVGGDGTGVALKKGESVTLTVFFPPVDLSDVKIRMNGVNTGCTSATLKKTEEKDSNGNVTSSYAMKASTKKKTAVTVDPTKGTNWISELDEDVLVQQLSIPGSNESVSYLSSNNWTQSINVIDQLNAGIRAFDIHVKHASSVGWGSSFDLNYSGGSTNLKVYSNPDNISEGTKTVSSSDNTLHVLLTQVFLPWLKDDRNKNEFLVVMLSCASNSTWSNLKNRIESDLGENNDTYWTAWKKNLTLKDVRGKIIFICREVSSESSMGDKIAYTQDDFNACTGVESRKLLVRRSEAGWLKYYAKNSGTSNYTEDPETRFNQIKTVFDDAKTEKSNSELYWHMTYIGGARTENTAGYIGNAQAMNPRLYNYLMTEQTNPGPLGIVFCDFIGGQTMTYNGTPYTVDGVMLPAAIISQNAKFELKKGN